ncbi:MAG: PAS domain S-box protein [candidate division Zixibacteria bacterium]|nr:PAS domain S-box protein [Candidatus Tariuqbacter arcticus]
MRRKLNLGFFAIIILLWAICIYAMLSSIGVRDVFTDLENDIVPGAIEMSEMKYAATDIRMWTLTYIVRGNVIRNEKTIKEWLQEAWTTIENDAKEHREHEKHIGKLEKEATEKINDLSQKVVSVSAEIIEMKDKGAGDEELYEKVRKDFAPVFYPLRNILNEHTAAHLKELSATENNIQNKHNIQLRYIIILGLVTTLLAVFVGLLVDRLFVNFITERECAEKALRVSEEKYRMVVENQGEGIGIMDLEERFVFCNPAGEKIFGVEPAQLLNRNLEEFISPENYKFIKQQTKKCLAGQKSIYEIEIIQPSGEKRQLLITATTQKDSDEQVIGTFGIFRDITERKRAEEERERLIQELQEALDKIKTLKGFIPICSHCKKIRDDKGFWQNVEVYVRDHSEAEFSHGICPDCMKKLYPEYYREGDEGADPTES